MVNKSVIGDNLLIGRMPAIILKETEVWYVRGHYIDNVEKVEKLRESLGL